MLNPAIQSQTKSWPRVETKFKNKHVFLIRQAVVVSAISDYDALCDRIVGASKPTVESTTSLVSECSDADTLTHLPNKKTNQQQQQKQRNNNNNINHEFGAPFDKCLHPFSNKLASQLLTGSHGS